MYLAEVRVTEFNDESAGLFRTQVLEHALNYPKDPIRVYIDSSGGDVDALASMVATMKSVPNLIHTICLGKAYSCGAFLLALGDIRSASPYATIMLHEVSASSYGTKTQMENNINEIKRQNKTWLQRIATACNKTYKEMTEAINAQDLYFTTKQAKKFGLIDRMHVPRPEFKEEKLKIKPPTASKKELDLDILIGDEEI